MYDYSRVPGVLTSYGKGNGEESNMMWHLHDAFPSDPILKKNDEFTYSRVLLFVLLFGVMR